MKPLDISNYELKELSSTELRDINGGLLIALAMYTINTAAVAGTISAAGAAIYASFKSGYKQACGCYIPNIESSPTGGVQVSV